MRILSFNLLCLLIKEIEIFQLYNSNIVENVESTVPTTAAANMSHFYLIPLAPAPNHIEGAIGFVGVAVFVFVNIRTLIRLIKPLIRLIRPQIRPIRPTTD